ncbi:unnamed protein product [Chondrus crispus]|uniref:Uncharacterized protein n=1 Tax=Chondrus crispus TaxID=2769 RepID=R7Q3B0_CHOCR|nr:unnamed protein product [Chondrus crispus]CDF32479.1 unnamed protein product [Chondrus crispus]|eukprot:XP_005712144.1 unnamed protein product [Chondrus crispus]
MKYIPLVLTIASLYSHSYSPSCRTLSRSRTLTRNPSRDLLPRHSVCTPSLSPPPWTKTDCRRCPPCSRTARAPHATASSAIPERTYAPAAAVLRRMIGSTAASDVLLRLLLLLSSESHCASTVCACEPVGGRGGGGPDVRGRGAARSAGGPGRGRRRAARGAAVQPDALRAGRGRSGGCGRVSGEGHATRARGEGTEYSECAAAVECVREPGGEGRPVGRGKAGGETAVDEVAKIAGGGGGREEAGGGELGAELRDGGRVP